ncbi:isoflavone reductase [Striga asiatica]|uniref:Isoflavone reductase n=1 Tax=Striga asiatica TaxID=4170 RepID=A0A5A7QXD3_STRAF|nr:isoflavone reductase [Striga asiatica]
MSRLKLKSEFWLFLNTKGKLDEHGKLVSALKEVDIVISALAVPQHLDQLNIITSKRPARFVPSEFGNEVDRVSGALPPFQKLLDDKKKIRRATEEAGIPFTLSLPTHLQLILLILCCIQINSPMNSLFMEMAKTKAVWNYEEDIAVSSFELAVDDLEASKLYPEHKYTSIDNLLNRCLVDPPKTKLASFA